MSEETVTLGTFYPTELRILPGGHVQLRGRIVAPGPLQPWSIAAGRPGVIHVGRVEGGHAWEEEELRRTAVELQRAREVVASLEEQIEGLGATPVAGLDGGTS